MRRWLWLCVLLLWALPVHAQIYLQSQSGCMRVQEVDGTPSGCWTSIRMSNGTITDNGDGTATINVGTGSGTGDVNSAVVVSVDGEMTLFSGTGGKTIKRATITGLLKATSGVASAAVAGTDYVLPSGNVATATALAADGSNCPAGQIPLGVDASGNVQGCYVLTNVATATALAANGTNCNPGEAAAGVDASGNAEGCFTPAGGIPGGATALDLGNNGSNESASIAVIATTGDTNGVFTEPTADKLLIDLTKRWPAADVAVTATALSANGGNCAAGSAPLGVDASGVAEGCFDVATQVELDAHAALTAPHSATAANTPNRLVLRDASGNFAAGTITATLAGQASTAQALTSNGANCAVGNAPIGVDAQGAAEGCFDVATQGELDTHINETATVHGATSLNLPGRIVQRNANGDFVAGTITATLTGNASTATALATNGTNCGAGQAAAGVDAQGNAEGCVAVSVSGGTPLVLDLGDNGSNESVDLAKIAVIGDTNAIFTEPTPDKLLIDVSKRWPTADLAVQATNAATATALAANGANCTTGNAPLGVDAAGAVEGCFDVATQVELDAHTTNLTNAHGATSSNTPSRPVARDASGNFSAGTITAALAGNANTASALASNGGNCPAGQAPLGVDTTGTAEGCFDVATEVELAAHLADQTSVHGATSANTANRIVQRDASGNFVAGTITAALSGNASTASALAANGTNCAGGLAAAGVDAQGNAEGCFTPSGGVGHTIQDEGTPLPTQPNLNFTGPGVTCTNSVGTNASICNIPGTAGGLPDTAGNGFVVRSGAGPTTVNRTLQGTANQIAIANANGLAGDPIFSIPSSPTFSGTVTAPTFNGALAGNAGTATALAANGTNCSAGQAAGGVDASGNAENCFTPTTGASVFGTPIAGQLAIWHDGTSIEGVSSLSITYSATLVTTAGTPTTGLEYVRTGASALTRTLPPAGSGTNSRQFIFYKEDSAAGAMTITPAGSNTINGVSGVPGSVSTTTQWGGFVLHEVSTTGWVATPISPTLTPPVSGTSGGIPYYNTATSQLSSGVLTASMPVLGGGAGASPIVGTKSNPAGTEFATSTGSKAGGKQLIFDVSGNVIASTFDAAQVPVAGGSGGHAQYNTGTTFGGSTGLTLNATELIGTARRITNVTASKVLDFNDGPVVACAPSSAANITLQLPAGATTNQRDWAIVKTNATTTFGQCLVQGNATGSETINGSTGAMTAATQWSRVDVSLNQTTGTPNWSGIASKTSIDLATDIGTSILPIANGGTGAATLAGAGLAQVGVANPWTAGIKQTFAPNATNPGVNVGSFAGNPSTPANGDLWYNSTGNALQARINGATVSLGAGAATPVRVPIRPYSAIPVTAGMVFSLILDGDEMLGVADATTLTSDAIWRLGFEMPPTLDTGCTYKLQLDMKANATTGVIRINPKWNTWPVGVTRTSLTLNAETVTPDSVTGAAGSGDTVTLGAGDANQLIRIKWTLNASTVTAAQRIAMDLTFEDASTTLAVSSGYLPSIICE
jgi:hypothetical protein